MAFDIKSLSGRRSAMGKPGFESRDILIRVPTELLERFDITWRKLGYTNRNEAIREAMRLFIEVKGR